MINACEIIRRVKDTPGTNAKQEILKQGDSAALRNLLRLTYHPFWQFRLQQVIMPDTYAEVKTDVLPAFESLCIALRDAQITPKQGQRALRDLLARVTEADAQILAAVVRKDLKAGIQATTVNKVFPDLVPSFKVQLGSPVVDKKSGKSRWESLNWPIALEEKFDGMRILCVCHGTSVDFFSREGKPVPGAPALLEEQILKLHPGQRFVLDGEGIGTTLCPACAAAVTAQSRGSAWKFTQGISMLRSRSGYTPEQLRQHLGYFVYDCIDYQYFTSQGKGGISKPFENRRAELVALLNHNRTQAPNIHLVDSRVAHSRDQVLDFARTIWAQGGEGAMLKRLERPYSFKRGDDILKLKQFNSADLRIVDALPGKEGTKYADVLGTLLVSDDNGIEGKVMGGFTDLQRADLWSLHREGSLVGSIVEVEYMELTAHNSLRHATFLRMRDDKSECSWN
jgi:DNA ligase-1